MKTLSNMNSIKTLTLLAFLFTLSAFSQTTANEEDNLSLNSGTLNNQFEYLIKKSNGWTDERGQNYRVIKAQWLADLKSHALDSLKAVRKDLVAIEITVKAQTQEISDLKTSLTTSQANLEKTKGEKDNISLLGIPMSKSGYSMFMWGFIAVLLILLSVFIYKFKNSNVVTKDAQRTLSELEDEFEEHRKTAVEREQRVRRQLQDEINKQKITKNNS